MTTPNFSRREPSLYNGRPKPRPSVAHANPTDVHYALTAGQREILAMLEGQPPAQAETSGEAATSGVGLEVLFAAVGVAAILAGTVLVFFFAAVGAIVLVVGAILCAVAFEHVALRDLSADEAELETKAAAKDIGAGMLS